MTEKNKTIHELFDEALAQRNKPQPTFEAAMDSMTIAGLQIAESLKGLAFTFAKGGYIAK